MTKLTAFAAALVALGFATSATGGPYGASLTDDSISVTVRTAGLNLQKEAGAMMALDRIRVAASQVCGHEPDVRLLRQQARYRSCLKTTVDRAVASVDSPVLAALNGTPKPATLAAVTH